MEIKTISALIQHLEKIKEEQGDIHVCVSESDDYWGSVETWINIHNLNIDTHAQPDGPKSGKSVRALVFKY